MEDRLAELYEGVAVHATADREHMAALELLAVVMLADSHLSDDELGVLRELSEDWRGTAFSYEQYLGQAMATARQAWARTQVTELLDDIDSRITSGCCAGRCSRPPVSWSAPTGRQPRGGLHPRRRSPSASASPRGLASEAASATIWH